MMQTASALFIKDSLKMNDAWLQQGGRDYGGSKTETHGVNGTKNNLFLKKGKDKRKS